MNHFTIVTARAHNQYQTSGRYIASGDLRTCARTAEAARLAVFTLAGEADAATVRGLRWAASMIFYMLRTCKPSTPPSAPRGATPLADSAALRAQAHMMQITGETNPLRAHDVLMAEWLAKHPNPQTKPAPEPRPFAPAVPVDVTLAKVAALKRRHILTAEDRRRAGRTTANKPAPRGRACPYCRVSSDGFASHLAFAGHIGYCSFTRKYADGDKRRAGDMLSRWGRFVTDPVPANGAWQQPGPWTLSA